MNKLIHSNTALVLILVLLNLNLSAKDYYEIEQENAFIQNESLSENNREALSEAAISLYMVKTAQKYSNILTDSIFLDIPLEDRYIRTYIVNPNDDTDTLYQIDLRIYSPLPVGSRFNRMLIIRPYDKVERPCILYTHGNNGNLHTWFNYYLIGATNFLRRGYAIAFYENYNNNFFVANNKTLPVYRDWVHHNLGDSTQELSADHAVQRGHYLLYQYAYAAQVYLNYIADDYHINKNMFFAAGHSAGSLSSMELTFANPTTNFQHPVFNYCGLYNARCYPNLSEDVTPVKAVFSSAGGLQDDLVQGSYFGKYLDESDKDKVAVMIHGLQDPLAPVDYGAALWSNFVDTVKLMGPLTLHGRMDEIGIQNFSFINCSGLHGVLSYPTSSTDNSGTIKLLSPLNYSYDTLNNQCFYTDTSLYQLSLYHQQLNDIIGKAAQVFSKKYNSEEIKLNSAIYTWQTKDNQVPIDMYDIQDWTPVVYDCGVATADFSEFELYPKVPVKSIFHSEKNIKIYPNPAQQILSIDGLEENQTYLIYDITGKIIFSSYRFGKEKASVDISHFPNGTYFVLVRDMNSQEAYSKKFIILR